MVVPNYFLEFASWITFNRELAIANPQVRYSQKIPFGEGSNPKNLKLEVPDGDAGKARAKLECAMTEGSDTIGDDGAG